MDGFETGRLDVRNWDTAISEAGCRAALADELRAILTKPVLAHLPPALQDARADIDGWITARAAESDVFLVRGADKTLIGLLILARMGAGEPIHIGYLLAEAAWGHGYATELVQGLVHALATQAQLDLYAGVDAANLASTRVLEKVGFSRIQQGDAPGQAMYHLRLSRTRPAQ